MEAAHQPTAQPDTAQDGTDIRCPACGSDDLGGERTHEGTIRVTCLPCGHMWDRTPRPGCPRCASRDVEVFVERRWISTDGSWHPRPGPGDLESVQVEVGTCRACRHTWTAGES